jgi:hypothetical protein
MSTSSKTSTPDGSERSFSLPSRFTTRKRSAVPSGFDGSHNQSGRASEEKISTSAGIRNSPLPNPLLSYPGSILYMPASFSEICVVFVTRS